jgi:hypothetical protein
LTIDLTVIRRQWERGMAEGGALLAEAESRVAEWRFTKSMTLRERDLQPYWHERQGWSRGRMRSKALRSWEDFDEYGVDDAERVVVSRRHYAGETRAGCVLYAPLRAEGYDFDERMVLTRVRRYRLQRSRVLEAIEFSDHGYLEWAREAYTYDAAGRVVGIRLERDSELEREPGPPRAIETGQERVYYDAAGDLAAITGTANGRAYLCYAHVTAEAAALLEAQLPGRLADEVRTRFAAERFGHPPWALVLHYQSQHAFPPEVVVGLLPPDGPGDRDPSNPADWNGDAGMVLRLEDPALLNDCLLLRTHLQTVDDRVHRTRSLAERTLGHLQETDWAALSQGTAIEPFRLFALPVDPADP